MSRNFYDFYRLDDESKLTEWGGTFSIISILLFCAGLLFILNPDYLPESWRKIPYLNDLIGTAAILAAIYEMTLIIRTWLIYEKRKKDAKN